MIGMDGYLKLIDLGLCKKLSISERTKTYCGTIEYMAPEMVTHSPYGFPIDVWGFGILIYELTKGETPFYSSSAIETLRKINEDDPNLSGMNDETASICKICLIKD